MVLDLLLLTLTIVSGVIRIRLIKTMGIRVNVSLIGLCRSYVTVLIQFGILYFDVWVLTKNLNNSAFNVMNDSDANNFWAMFGHFLYFSCSTFTNVGAEAAITTHGSIGQILNCTQMVMAVIFHTVVFGVSLLDISSHRIIDTEKFVSTTNAKKTNTLRNVGLIQRQIRQIAHAQQHGNDYANPDINSISINHSDMD